MVARVSVYDIPGERSDEAAASFSSALDTIAHVPGFDHAYFLVSTEAGRGIAVTFWASHDAMAASRVTATRLRGDAARAVDGEIVLVDEFEVAVRVDGPGGAPR